MRMPSGTGAADRGAGTPGPGAPGPRAERGGPGTGRGEALTGRGEALAGRGEALAGRGEARAESGETRAERDEALAERDESAAERADRNLAELLQELRVAGLGVQVLFGFLLSIPFTNRFAALSQAQRQLYIATLMLAALSTALLLGPVAYHRLVFRLHQKERLVRAANVMAICGLAAVGLAISAAVLLVTGFVDRGLPAVLITVCTVGLFGGLWFVLPLAHRRRPDE